MEKTRLKLHLPPAHIETALKSHSTSEVDVRAMKLKQASLVTIVALFSIVCKSITSCAAANLASFPLTPHHDVPRPRRLKKQGINDDIKMSDEGDNNQKQSKKEAETGAGSNQGDSNKKQSKKEVQMSGASNQDDKTQKQSKKEVQVGTVSDQDDKKQKQSKKEVEISVNSDQGNKKTKQSKKEAEIDAASNPDDKTPKQSKKEVQVGTTSDQDNKKQKQSKKEAEMDAASNLDDKKKKQSKKEVQVGTTSDQDDKKQKQSKKEVEMSVTSNQHDIKKKQSKKEVQMSAASDPGDKTQKQSKKEVKMGAESDQGDKKKKQSKKGVQMSALYYGKGKHYVDLWCGTPPQRQTVIVDTGSAMTSFPCSGCADCGAGKYHINNAFDEKVSSTFSVASCDDCQGICTRDGNCIFNAYHSESSFWAGFKARDRCYLGGPHNAPLLEKKGTESIDPDHAKAITIDLDFGCQTSVGREFKTQLADGIMGMGDDNRTSWSQLYKSDKGGSRKQFSLCFARPLKYNRTGTVAGAITLGGSDTRLHLSPMVFAKRNNTEGYYKVHIRKIHLRHGQGGESARSNNPNATLVTLDIKEDLLNTGGVIIDTGTTDTLFNRVISSQFRAAFKEITRGTEYSSDNKWDLKTGQLEIFPTILVQLEGERAINKDLNPDPSQVVGLAGDMDPDHPHDVILAIPPSHYMELGLDGMYTPRLFDTEESGSVLGAYAITGHDVLFDMDRQVIGWAESLCDYHTLVTGNGFRDVLEGPLYKEVPSYSDSSEDDDDDDDNKNTDDDEDSSSDSEDPFFLEKKALESALRKFGKATNSNNNEYGCYRWEVLTVLGMLLVIERFCIGKICCKSKPLSPTKYKKLDEKRHSADGQSDPLNNEERIRIDLRRRS